MSGDATPKDKKKCQALLKLSGVINGVVTSKYKAKAMPSLLAEKKKKQ